MHIQKIEIENVRGIRHWDEDFGNDNVRILGPNGSGKSSVIQAVEFVLTGDIKRLRGQGTRDIPFSEYASHMDANPDEAWVIATFKEAGNPPVSVKRWISEPENLEIVEPTDHTEIPDWLHRQMDAASLGHSILDRSRLLRFVTAPEGKRGDRIDELFRLENVDEKRKSLKRAVRDQQSDKSEKADAKEAADQLFFELFSGLSTRSQVIEFVNRVRQEHGAAPIETLDEDFTEDIEVSEEISVDALQSEATVSLLNRIRSNFDDRKNEFHDQIETLVECSESLDRTEHIERELNTLDLVENGLSLVDEYDEACPLCQKHWDEDDLVSHLEERKDHASHLQDLKGTVDSAYSDLNTLLVEYTENLSQLRTELADDYPDAAETIESVTTLTLNWKEKLNEGAFTEFPSDTTVYEDIFPETLQEKLQQLSEEAEGDSELKSATKNVDLLARADERYDELIEKEDELHRANNIENALESVQDAFLDARNRVLTEAFDEISTRFESYYEQMHQDEEADEFSAVLEPTSTGVKFEPKFHDKGHHHPGAVHSEGHRDSMGLALFLAMSDVGGEDIDILLLDDVMMSIDSGHRSNIATLLGEDISDRYQILHTTHDKTWDRHLKLTQNFEKQVRFSKCSFGAGPLPVDSISDPWERIEYHLEQDDVTAAAAWIRKTVEWYSRRACQNLGAKVPYHKLEDDEFSIGGLFEAAIGRYDSLLDSNGVVEETEYGQSLYSREQVEAEREAVQEVIQEKERHLNLLNANVHYNEPEAAFYTGEELKNERDAFKNAFDLLYCTDCGSWVKNGDSVYCDCTIRVG